jgi:Kdo2-lipid IVA lauroyltransferase/acyltransferase
MRRLFEMFSGWPLGLLHALGLVIGWAGYALSPSYRRRVNLHTRRAGLSRWQRWAAIGHAGKMVAEAPRLWGRPAAQPLGTSVRWEHAEALDQAVSEGRGVMLLTAHLGCFEMVAQAYAERHGLQHPITALYRPAKQPWLADLMLTARTRPGMNTSPVTLTGVRQLMRALKQGDTIGILPDQVPPAGLGEWAPFFGQPAYTMTMAAKLAGQTRCAVVLLRGERLSWWQRRQQGCDFVVHAQRLPAHIESLFQSGNSKASALAINAAMEQLIMSCPEQYLWGYNRYKGPKSEMLTSRQTAKD